MQNTLGGAQDSKHAAEALPASVHNPKSVIHTVAIMHEVGCTV